MRSRLSVSLLAVLLFVFVAGATETEPLYEEIAEHLTRLFPREHARRQPVNDTVARRVWTNYLSALDYDRMVFLQADIDTFAEQAPRLDTDLRRGDLSFALTVHERYEERLRNRCAYVGQLLENGFDFTRDEAYQWKRQDAAWPADETAWDELWRVRIKNEKLAELLNAEAGEAPNETNAVFSTTIPQRYANLLKVTESMDTAAIYELYLTAFCQAYDPHSAYMSPASREDFAIEMKLSLVGIGALLLADDGAAKVARLVPGGPADRDTREQRLRPGDRIVAVAQGNGPPVDIRTLPLSRAVQLIRGEKGTTVTLTVIPGSDPTGTATKIVDLVRDEVRLEEQAVQHEVKEQVPDSAADPHRLGVLSLPAFYANLQVESASDPEYRSSAHDLRRALGALKAEDAEGILLDLRNNGGGALVEASTMVGFFIPTGPTVLVKERHALRGLPDDDPEVVYDGPLVVLVNRLSASASEILAGALQDYGRAVIVGDSQTHGKGTVQTIWPLGRDDRLGAARITTASYFRITGSSTQSRGVRPDILLPSVFDYMELGEAQLPNAMPWSEVRPALFTPLYDLRPTVDALREASLKRRASSARFDDYGRLLTRVGDMYSRETLPLNRDARRELAATEQEVSGQRDEATGAALDSPYPNGEDLVLEEGLHILADLVRAWDDIAPLAVVEPVTVRSRTTVMIDRLGRKWYVAALAGLFLLAVLPWIYRGGGEQ